MYYVFTIEKKHIFELFAKLGLQVEYLVGFGIIESTKKHEKLESYHNFFVIFCLTKKRRSALASLVWIGNELLFIQQ